jgi:hypothetical protein
LNDGDWNGFTVLVENLGHAELGPEDTDRHDDWFLLFLATTLKIKGRAISSLNLTTSQSALNAPTSSTTRQ